MRFHYEHVVLQKTWGFDLSQGSKIFRTEDESGPPRTTEIERMALRAVCLRVGWRVDDPI
jgi:hypothetical protein